MTKIGIIDYGCGNIQSVVNAFSALGAKPDLVRDPDDVDHYDQLVLPGVGAFQQAMDKLESRYFVEALNHKRAAGTPILGICLGMQLLCSNSDETQSNQNNNFCAGLGWIDAQVRHFAKLGVESLKIPHMGWNEIRYAPDAPLFQGLSEQPDVYFVHSHAVIASDDSSVLASTRYGIEFASAIHKDNVIGLQFHPEKSHKVGLKILENFLRL